MIKKEVHHLSHIDLDGYSCQIIAKRIYENINFYNSNYGKEIDQRLQQIVNAIKLSQNSEFLILFTDLNLTLEQAEFIVKETVNIEDKEIELLLLDHHKSGQDCANIHEWYNLDVNRCATKITYDYFKSSGLIDDLDEYVNIVNAYDIWLTDQHDRFEIGKVCARYVSSAREINRIMFSDKSFEYVLAMVEKASKIITQKDAHIALDDMLHSSKKEFFIKDKNNTLDNLVSYYVVDLLSKNRDNMTITYKDKKGILTFQAGNISIIGNEFLVQNPDYDFFLDINGKKNISARANNNCDVSILASEVFGGGGHANASGGRFQEFKESFIYEEIKAQVQKRIRDKESK